MEPVMWSFGIVAVVFVAYNVLFLLFSEPFIPKGYHSFWIKSHCIVIVAGYEERKFQKIDNVGDCDFVRVHGYLWTAAGLRIVASEPDETAFVGLYQEGGSLPRRWLGQGKKWIFWDHA